ncbi:antitoxin [Ornithinimicrobium sp. LYQ92]|uniref:antitoxin n=1 Tax=Serinicoccus sp. LYQ92 TaxID=3378798 RepID=UPI0038540952
MSFVDKAKDFASRSSAKARDLAREHSDTIDQGIQRAGTFVDDKTGGRYADKVDKVQGFATQQKDKIAGGHGGEAPGPGDGGRGPDGTPGPDVPPGPTRP